MCEKARGTTRTSESQNILFCKEKANLHLLQQLLQRSSLFSAFVLWEPKNEIISLRYNSQLFKTVFLDYINLLCE